MSFTETGILLGALFGLAHAAYVFGVVATSGGTKPANPQKSALYAAVWTFLLWLLFGTYLLLFWLLGGLLYLASRWWR
jgi:hypothetical protein